MELALQRENDPLTESISPRENEAVKQEPQINMQKHESIPPDHNVAPMEGAVVYVQGEKSQSANTEAPRTEKTSHDAEQMILTPTIESQQYTDMSSLSYFPSEAESNETLLEPNIDGRLTPNSLPQEERKTSLPSKQTASTKRSEPNASVQRSTSPEKAFQGRVRSLSDYKIDPDELTTEISVRLANHVAPKRGILRTLRNLLVVLVIVAIHVAVFYFVGNRIQELLYVTQ